MLPEAERRSIWVALVSKLLGPIEISRAGSIDYRKLC